MREFYARVKKSSMISSPKFTKGQYLFFASAAKTIAEGIILGSSAAFFLPETLQLKERIAVERYFAILTAGLIVLAIGAILTKLGERR